MTKPRVIFPFTEAGLGHIMPMRSIADEFERLYGDRVDVVRSEFFTEGGNERLISYEKHLHDEVVKHNEHSLYGRFATFSMDFWGTRIASWATMRKWIRGAYDAGVKHIKELKPDLVFSTHWATNYYAYNAEPRPLTVMYCPDAHVNTLFRYAADLVLTSMSTGYERALRMHPGRFNADNLKLVPFLIREEAFSVPQDKALNRRKLGFDENKFTVALAEGGYGIGKMQKICEVAIERDLPVTLVPICGKNEKLYEYFLTLKSKGKLDFRPQGFTQDIFTILAASDLFCGKSGASMMAEPCFFGVPVIVTKYATKIEQLIGEYYIDAVGSAIKEFNPSKAVDLIEKFAASPELLQPYRLAAEAQRSNYGPEKTARLVYRLLKTRFPELGD
ncbi:MAG TPA: hypothetical protein DIV38_01270 [Clostridiales bacterium]|nr:hypothetical protein [Clostridiales bacterium]